MECNGVTFSWIVAMLKKWPMGGLGGPERCDPHAYGNRCISGTNNATKINCSSKDVEYVGETFLLSIYSSNKQPFLRTQRKCVKPDMYVLMSTVVVTLPYLHLYCVHSKADHYSWWRQRQFTRVHAKRYILRTDLRGVPAGIKRKTTSRYGRW